MKIQTNQNWELLLFSKMKDQTIYTLNYSKFKPLFCQMRIGMLPLEIERGRHTGGWDGICKLCKSDIEDEIHFVCPTLQTICHRSCSNICLCHNEPII